jgi:hypothetical protein
MSIRRGAKLTASGPATGSRFLLEEELRLHQLCNAPVPYDKTSNSHFLGFMSELR